MDKSEQSAKQSVLKGIIGIMGKMNAKKLQPKKEEPKVEAKEESKDPEITPEMLEKLKSFYAEKKKDESSEKEE